MDEACLTVFFHSPHSLSSYSPILVQIEPQSSTIFILLYFHVFHHVSHHTHDVGQRVERQQRRKRSSQHLLIISLPQPIDIHRSIDVSVQLPINDQYDIFPQ
jgi:hypothetical protein